MMWIVWDLFGAFFYGAAVFLGVLQDDHTSRSVVLAVCAVYMQMNADGARNRQEKK